MNCEQEVQGLDELRTLPDHARCTTHRQHKLGCQQYEQLLARSDRLCEICGFPGWATAKGKLHIDHHGWPWAVRGLLCNTCNTRLEDGSVVFNGTAEYLARTWWVQECARVGVPTSMRPEPEIGSVIRDQWMTFWIREADGQWRPHGSGKPGISSITWQRLFEIRGPQNMASFDPYGPSGVDWIQWVVERARRPPAPPPQPKTDIQMARERLPWLHSPETTAKALLTFMSSDECQRLADLLRQET